MLKFMKLGGIFDIEAINKKIEELEQKTFETNFWNTENSQEILKNISVNKKMIEEYEELNSALDDLNTMVEFIEMGDDSFESEIGEKLHEAENKIQDFKIKLLLDEKYDSNNAILTINSGAGGTEACDWAEMLYRLYDRWANKHDVKVEILDSLAGFIDLLEFLHLTRMQEGTLLLQQLMLFLRLKMMLKLILSLMN